MNAGIPALSVNIYLLLLCLLPCLMYSNKLNDITIMRIAISPNAILVANSSAALV